MKTSEPTESMKAGPSGSEGTGVGQGFSALMPREHVRVDWKASQPQASVRPCGAWRNRQFGWGVQFFPALLFSVLGLSPKLGHSGLFKISPCLACGRRVNYSLEFTLSLLHFRV